MTKFNGRVGHLEGITAPWANAGGVVLSINDVLNMAQTAVGWVEAGSFTLERRLNKVTMLTDQPQYQHNPYTGETFSNDDMPNKGMDVVEVEIPEMVRVAHQYGKQLVVNVAPVSEDPVEESIELVRRAQAAGADCVLLNAGYRNVKAQGGEPNELLSRSPATFGKVLNGLYEANVKPIWVRLSPQERIGNCNSITAHILGSRVVSAVATPNVWNTSQPRGVKSDCVLSMPVGFAGKSGWAMADSARRETRLIGQALGFANVDVISSSGIDTARELKHRLFFGAKAGAGTTFYYESQDGWADDTGRLLSELAA